MNMTKNNIRLTESKLREMVQEIDPNAFIFVTKATEVRGLGFNFETPEHIERHRKKK